MGFPARHTGRVGRACAPQRGHLNPQLRPSMAVNEHLCQSAAARLGLDAAATSLELFDDEACLVTERFDRRVDRGEVWRCHFEDLCQASGFAPVSRYQESGGPTPERLMKLLSRETGRAGARMFFMSMFYNWLVGNTDGHSKNYGVLFDGPAPRLAPLYDLSSVAPYLSPDDWLRPSAMRFAESHPASVSQWAHTAARLNVGVAGDELSTFAEALPDAFSWAVSRCPAWASDTAEQVGEAVVAHARTASAAGGSAGSSASFEPLRSVDAVDGSGMCGATVERTGKPCLLRSGHTGRCRSVR